MLQQLSAGVRRPIKVTQNDFGEGVTPSALQGGKQLVGGGVYRDGFSHA